LVSIRYKGCTVEGGPASAVLAFKESVAQSSQEVLDQIRQLENVAADRIDDQLTMSAVTPQPLRQVPTGAVLIHSAPEQQGTLYRETPQVAPPNAANPGGGLVGAGETALAQWMFGETSPTDPLRDSSFYNKTALLTGTATSEVSGPLGTSRVVGPGSYWVVPTGPALLDSSIAQTMIKQDLTVWGWFRPDDLSAERVICSYSSPAQDPTTILPAVCTAGGTLVVSTSGLDVLAPGDRLYFTGDPSGYEVAASPAPTPTACTLTSPVTAPLSNVKTYRSYPALPFTPESRNTLYGLSVNTAGHLRAYWEHNYRETVEAINTTAIPAGQFFFAGLERRTVRLTGTCLLAGTAVTGTGTLFTTELAVGHWVQFDGLSDSYRVNSITDATHMTVAQTGPTDLLGRGLATVDTMLSVGKLDGSWSSQTTRGLHPPTGGNEPGVPGQPNPPSRGNFMIARDATRGLGWSGALDALTLFNSALDTAGDSNLYHHFTRAFPDYLVTSGASTATVQRSPVSDITDGQLVYAQYPYVTGLTKSAATTDQTVQHLDGIVAGLGNPQATSISQLSQSIGTPDPATSSSKSQLESELLPYGLMVGGGAVVPQGSVDLTAFASLSLIVGLDNALALVQAKIAGWFVLVATVEERTIKETVDACGVPSSTVEITERIVGINRNLAEAAVAAGLQETSQLKCRLWWIGAPSSKENVLARMRALGMNQTQIANALALVSVDNFTIWVIGDATAPGTIAGTIGNGPLGTILDRPTLGALPGATPQEAAKAVQDAIVKGPGQTIDGDDTSQDPALLVASVVDFEALHQLTSLFEDMAKAALDAADPGCTALFACIDDLLRNLIMTLRAVQSTIVPYSVHEKRAIGANKLALARYIPCVGVVSASVGLPPFHVKIQFGIQLLNFAAEQERAVVHVAIRAIEAFEVLLCISRTFISALRGGTCGIQQPKVFSNRSCPVMLDTALDRLKELVETIELLLQRILLALTSLNVDLEVSIGAATQIGLDASLPCVGPVAKLMIALG